MKRENIMDNNIINILKRRSGEGGIRRELPSKA
jgi:hypothetical protein